MSMQAFESAVSQEHQEAITAAGLDFPTVLNWIASHGYQGAALLRMLLPMMPFSPAVKDAILFIVNLLYPVVAA